MKRLLSLFFALILVLSACAQTASPPPVTSAPPISDLPVIAPGTESESEAVTDPVTLPPATDAPVTDPPQTDPPPPPPPEDIEITLLSAGDIMFHHPNLKAAYDSKGDGYDFDPFFQYLNPIVSRYDYAVANLETTVSGKDLNYTPSGVSSFNTPEAALDTIKQTGFDMMLFANNHTFDRRLEGVKRTVSTLREKGFDTIGARESTDDAFWQVIDVKGVKIGMMNYTNDAIWADWSDNNVNGIPLTEEQEAHINLFYLGQLACFYESVEQDLAEMEQAGADLTVMYIHWGLEYYTQPHAKQTEIAQRLCDLGVDAIVGSHPHVIQPVETFVSTTDPDHRTVCFYSLGNLISNQNRVTLSAEYCHGNNAYTENGLMVAFTIAKNGVTGETAITAIEAIPTWVHRYTPSGSSRTYRIIPLKDALQSPDAFGLNDSSFGLSHAKEALNMTEELVSAGIETYLKTP